MSAPTFLSHSSLEDFSWPRHPHIFWRVVLRGNKKYITAASICLKHHCHFKGKRPQLWVSSIQPLNYEWESPLYCHISGQLLNGDHIKIFSRIIIYLCRDAIFFFFGSVKFSKEQQIWGLTMLYFLFLFSFFCRLFPLCLESRIHCLFIYTVTTSFVLWILFPARRIRVIVEQSKQ